ALGTITFALAALPGSPQVHNASPTSSFGTNVYAAPYFGLGSAAVMLIAGIAWLEYRMKQIRKTGAEFMPIDSSGNFIDTPAGLGESSDEAAEKLKAYCAGKGPVGHYSRLARSYPYPRGYHRQLFLRILFRAADRYGIFGGREVWLD